MPSSFSKPAKPKDNQVPWCVLPKPVKLPVCPRCGHTGKNPGAPMVLYSCVGSQAGGTSHKRTRMVEVDFFPDTEGLELVQTEDPDEWMADYDDG